MGNTQYTIGSHHVTVVKQVAEGGFSYVYLARSTSLPHPHYALKKLHCQTPEQLTLAQQEIAALQRCRHQGVSRLVDHATVRPKDAPDDTVDVLLLFPYYPNGSLADLPSPPHSSPNPPPHPHPSKPDDPKSTPHHTTTRWPWSEEECIVFHLATCEALQAIHHQGYTHRDIKPHNILLASPLPRSSPSPSTSSSVPRFTPALMSHLSRLSLPLPVLIDLGSLTSSPLPIPTRSAALSHQDHAATHTTASYRPPELWQVKVGVELDGRVDVWGLGCVLYWVMTGRSAMEGEGGVSMLRCMEGRLEWEEGDRRRYSAVLREYAQRLVHAKYDERWQLDEAMQRAWQLLDLGQTARSAAATATEGWASFDADDSAQPKGKERKKSAVKKKEKEREKERERERVTAAKPADDPRSAAILSLDTAALAAALAGDDEEEADDADDGRKKGRKGRKKRREKLSAAKGEEEVKGEGEEGGEGGDGDDFADFQSASFTSVQSVPAVGHAPALSLEDEEEDEFSDFTGSGAVSPAG